MNQAKVSVLIPCYNAAKYFRNAIDSILNQTYRNLEIILIDDGSTDETGKLIHEYALLDKRIVAVHNSSNMGLIRTLNKGLAYITGEYTARMDADDISEADRIEKLMKEFEMNPKLDVISAGSYFIDTEGNITRQILPKAILSGSLKFVSFFCTPINHACVIAKSEVFKENLYDENFIHSEDYELFSRLLSLNYSFKNINDPLYKVRVNPGSVSKKFERIQISTHTSISQRNIENYFHDIPDFFLHKMLINRISFAVKADMLKATFEKLDEMRLEFIAREKSSPEVVREIDEFLIEQKIDILLQSIKQTHWQNMPALILQFLKNIKLFLKPRGYNYFLSKFSLTRKFSKIQPERYRSL
jgi:glycosyltransferase involved in cell wall biosynthesis